MRSAIVRHDHEGGDIPNYHEAVWLGESVLRDRTGREHRHGWTRFALVICNNPGCAYEALVNAEVVVAQVGGTYSRPDDTPESVLSGTSEHPEASL